MSRLLKVLIAVAAGAAGARYLARRAKGATPAPAAAPGVHAAAKPAPAAPPAPTPAPVAETPPAEARDDEEIARKVEAELDSAPAAAEADVSVEVEDGIAHLHGEVPDAEAADRLGAEARNVDGVKGVENLLQPERGD
jgi:hypothetical protein